MSERAHRPRRRRHLQLADRRAARRLAEPRAGSKVYDVDGNEYFDFHGGYGVSLAGHAHPAIVAAVTRAGQPAAPTSPSRPRTPSWSRTNLAERFGLPLWRFGNSGTESTMDAVHLMRAATGRDRIIKVEGGYHGHHDSVMVSVLARDVGDLGPADAPIGVPDNTGLPEPRSPTWHRRSCPSTTSTAVEAGARRATPARSPA